MKRYIKEAIADSIRKIQEQPTTQETAWLMADKVNTLKKALFFYESGYMTELDALKTIVEELTV